MNARKPPVTFAAMLVRAQRRFEAVGRAATLMAFPGADRQPMPIRIQATQNRGAAARK